MDPVAALCRINLTYEPVVRPFVLSLYDKALGRSLCDETLTLRPLRKARHVAGGDIGHNGL